MGHVLGRRIAAAFIDAVIIVILLVLIAKGLGEEGATKRSLWAEARGAPQILFLLLTFAYFFGTELAWAQTLGKRVMKLRVVREDGSKLGAGPAAIRNLVRFIDAFGFYLIGAIAVFATGERRQRLGDLAAKTKVVADDAPPPPPADDRRDRPEDDDILAQVLR